MSEKDKIVIGLGHTARQGKDTAAEKMKELLGSDATIVSWASPLKEEIANTMSGLPLVYRTYIAPKKEFVYSILDTYNPETMEASYISKIDSEVPLLHKIFQENNIDEYLGATTKDAPMLQFWGTDFRRAQNPDYWVNKIRKEIDENIEDYKYFIIPDTRFKNEYNCIKNIYKGVYIDVVRLNPDGTTFVATDRQPNHPSENELNGVVADFVISATSGDIETIYKQVTDIVSAIK